MKTPFRMCLFAAFSVFLFATAGHAQAAEYFVNKQGDDSNDGRSQATAFATVQKGVDALEPGDTLTIGPGEYHETVAREDLGGDEAQTTIRAAIRGTVLLRGDVDAPRFEPVEGYRFVYAADFDRPVQAVNEVDSLRLFERAPDVVSLEFVPGKFHYDPEAQKLYISTSDLQPPSAHHYTVSVLEARGGLYLKNPRRVVIDGIAATGYHSPEALRRQRGGMSSSDVNPHGIYLWGAQDSIIRHCTAYLNAGGITILSSGNNVIEDSVGYANFSGLATSGGNIVLYRVTGDTIRRSEAYKGQRHGIRMYGSSDDNPVGLIEDCLSWHNRGNDFQIKGSPAPQNSEMRRSVVPFGDISVLHVHQSLLRSRRDSRQNNTSSNIVLDSHDDLNLHEEFADPDNLDFRLQPDSQFREAGENGEDLGPHPYTANIYYVAPDGSDDATGLSIGQAWRTLAHAINEVGAGDTLYLEAGTYEGDVTLNANAEDGEPPLSIRGRGTGVVVIAGDVTIEDTRGIELERLNFTGNVIVRGSAAIRMHNNRFVADDTAIQVSGVEGLRLTHNLFTGFSEAAVAAQDSSGLFLQSNIFDNAQGAAVQVDTADAVFYSDYNSYRAGESAWAIAGSARNPAQLASPHERSAYVITPAFTEQGGVPQIANEAAFIGRGALGTALGVYRRFTQDTEPLRLAGPFVHSVTDTTANFEWWASGPTDVELAWGETLELEHTARRDAYRAGSFSLTDLKPDTRYHLRLTLDRPITLLEADEAHLESQDETSVTISFTTAASAPEPTTYHVAPEGNDTNNGLTRDEAWRTINHAANQARPGDTVLIAGGTYAEMVRVRATGDEERPITFKAAPGEKVVFDGVGRTLDCAFLAVDKSHLRFDGLYFKEFKHGSTIMPWSDHLNGRNASIVLYHSDDVHITRCFSDARGGYSPGILQALHSEDVLVRNCVVTGAMGGGLGIAGCPNMRVEHSVFLRNLISHLSEMVNTPDQKFHVTRNIFTDAIASKVGGALFAVGKVESMVEANNAYYLRIPVEERMFMMFYGPFEYERAASAYGVRTEFDEPAVIQELTRMNLPQYEQRFKSDTDANDSLVLDNPQFAMMRDMDATNEDGERVYLGDRLVGKDDLDFPDLFTEHPELVEQGIGLVPADFADFHFNQQ